VSALADMQINQKGKVPVRGENSFAKILSLVDPE